MSFHLTYHYPLPLHCCLPLHCFLSLLPITTHYTASYHCCLSLPTTTLLPTTAACHYHCAAATTAANVAYHCCLPLPTSTTVPYHICLVNHYIHCSVSSDLSCSHHRYIYLFVLCPDPLNLAGQLTDEEKMIHVRY